MTTVHRKVSVVELLFALTGIVLVSSSDQGDAMVTGPDQLSSIPSTRNQLLMKDIDLTIDLLKERFPPLLEGVKDDLSSIVPEWSGIVRQDIGEGICSLELKGSQWYFNGFLKEDPVALRGQPPAVFGSLKNLTIFGFDAMEVHLARRESSNCVDHKYKLAFPRVLVEFSDGKGEQEIVLDAFYVTDIEYCRNGEQEWSSFESEFYKFMVWWSCNNFKLDEPSQDLLAQVSWFIALQMGMYDAPYEGQHAWCEFALKESSIK